MSNETKRDVFERALMEWYDLIFKVGGQGNEAYGYCEFDVTISKYEKDYDAALPDDLPVIPEAVGKYIKEAKFEDVTLLEALGCARDPVFKNLGRWITSHSEEFSCAWLLGVWRVEETGEIVKLDEEK